MEIICNLPDNEDLHVTRILCEGIRGIFYILNIYITKNNTALIIYKNNKKIILDNNIKTIINLAKNTNHNEKDFDKIRKNIIEQFNNSEFYLFIDIQEECKDSINESDIIESIPYTNNLLYKLGVSIKLHKQKELFPDNDTSKYITLGKDLIDLSTICNNSIGGEESLLSDLIKQLICSGDILNGLKEKYINNNKDICREYKEIGKFCSECNNKENINEYILCKQTLRELLLIQDDDNDDDIDIEHSNDSILLAVLNFLNSETYIKFKTQ